jgi:hypothetical protein
LLEFAYEYQTLAEFKAELMEDDRVVKMFNAKPIKLLEE